MMSARALLVSNIYVISPDKISVYLATSSEHPKTLVRDPKEEPLAPLKTHSLVVNVYISGLHRIHMRDCYLTISDYQPARVTRQITHRSSLATSLHFSGSAFISR
ncbi:hypothetical protein N7G274_008358 [Stereocaulon virgatum]|uniref:Uncharacterized protein n=1 Tax=Stereocaulon virgatum TaxID=373712 RepID=A0ABR4A1H8_9LECA